MSEIAYTLGTTQNATARQTPLVLVYESHGQDCRYTPLGETCSTISQKYGTGGGNAPIVVKYEEDVSEHRQGLVE